MFDFLQLIFSESLFYFLVGTAFTVGCLMLTDEFKKFSIAKMFFITTVILLLGKVTMWTVLTNEKIAVRFVVTFIAFGIIGTGFAEAMRRTNQMARSNVNSSDSVDNNDRQNTPNPKPIEQQNTGNNGTNIAVTGGDHVTINVKQSCFRAAADSSENRLSRKRRIHYFFAWGTR